MMIESLIIIAIVILLVNIIVNYRRIEEILITIKIKEIVISAFQILLSIFICIIIINKGAKSLELFELQKEIYADMKKITEHQKIENEYYNKLMEMNYENQKYDEPYIPEGFSYVEGEWNTGYVIQDKEGNQYVWVPCTNQDIEGVTKVARRNFERDSYRSKDLCYDPECEEFIESALQNGGYYIARYEIGQDENRIAVIKSNMKIWTNINKKEALEIINKMNERYTTVRIELMNSYSYDTAFEWIRNTVDKEKLKYRIIENDESGNRYTGVQRYNNIYDLYDTTYEITTEIYYENMIISRGPSGIYNDIMDEENTHRLDNRSSLLWEKADNLGFRTILYK